MDQSRRWASLPARRKAIRVVERAQRFRHLYLYDASGRQISQLTSGDWEVTSLDAIDEGSGQVYFTATKQSLPGLPGIERQIYRVALDGSGFAAVTERPGTHEAFFSPGAKFFVDTFSTANDSPRQGLRQADGKEITAIEKAVSSVAEYKLPPVEFLTVKMHMGSEVNALMIRPPDFDTSRNIRRSCILRAARASRSCATDGAGTHFSGCG